MKLKILRFMWCAAYFAFATAALAAADDKKTSSADKAREAISVLNSGAPPAEKAIACKQLAIYGKPDAVPALAPLLADPDLSSWARIALEAIPGRAADDALREALGKVQGRLLVGVINSIGVRRDAKAVKDLEARLKDADTEVASAAAVALGHIGDDAAAKALEQSLAKVPVATRSAVAQGCILCAERFLAEKKYPKAARTYDVIRQADVPKQRMLEATRGAILARQFGGLPLLLETLRSPDKAVFGLGLRTSRELPGRAITEALAAEMGKASPERQGPLLLALADRNDDAVLPAVFQAAKNGSKSLRLVAVEVMVRSGNPASIPVLLDMLAASDAELVQAAKTALVGWSGEGLNPQLLARMTQAAGGTLRVLVEVAGQRAVAAAVPELVKASSNSDPAVRVAAIKALGETVSAADLDALTDLLAKAKSAEETSAVQEALESACTRIPDKAACADKLLARLPSSSVPAKCALLRVLGAVSTAKALDAVRSSLASPEPAVRDAAVRVLADWSEVSALPALLEVFRTTQDETHRFLALRGCVRLLDLGEQPAPEKVKTYAELSARTERADDRKALLSGLANVADPAALKLVEPLLADAQVQAEAELALLKIATAIAKSAPADAKAAATKLQAESKNQTTRERAAKLLGELEKNR